MDNITPDTIITAEIKCPRCDAPFSHFEGVNTRVFLCGSIDQRASIACNYTTTLRARVKELEEAGDSLQKRLRIWSNLCGKRFVVGDEEAIANWIAVKKKGTKP